MSACHHAAHLSNPSPSSHPLMQQIEMSTVGTSWLSDAFWNWQRSHLALSSQAVLTFETAVLDKQLARWSNGCLWPQTKPGIFVKLLLAAQLKWQNVALQLWVKMLLFTSSQTGNAVQLRVHLYTGHRSVGAFYWTAAIANCPPDAFSQINMLVKL